MIDFKRKMQVTLDAAAALMRGGQAAVPAVRDVPDGVAKNTDGSVTVTKSFRLDPKFVTANRQASKKRLQLAQAGQQRVLQPKFAGGLVGQPFISARDEAIPVEDMDTAVGDMIIEVGYHLFLVGGDVNRRIQGNDVNSINRSEVERVLTEAAFVRGISYGLAVSKDGGFQEYIDDEIREGERTLRYSYRHGFATPVHVTADPREYLKEHGVRDDLRTPSSGVSMDSADGAYKPGDRIRVKDGLRCIESGKPGTVVAVWEKPDDPFKGRVLVKIRMDSDGHEFSGFADSYVGERLTDVKPGAFACDSKGHDTPLENCKAQNPMFCPYHGIAAMSQNFIQCLNKYGLVGAYDHVPFEIFKKPSGAFAVSVNCGEMSQKAAENAIAEFLKQPGFIVAGGQTTSTGAVQGQVKQEGTFKQDYVYRPDDLSMLDEWMDSLYQSAADEDTVDLDALTEMESKVAGLKAMKNVSNPSAEQQQKYAELLKDAQDHYHGMKAKIDFKDLTDVDAASFKGKEIADQFEDLYGQAKKIQGDLQVYKQDTWGSTQNPVGFPGNDEMGLAGKKVFKIDGDLSTEAKIALSKAVNEGDLDAAKVALHNLQYAKEKLAKDLETYKVHADAMIGNLKLAISKGITKGVGKGKDAKMAWFEKMGIAYPEELKAVKSSVEAVTPGTEAFKQAQAAAKAAPKSTQTPAADPASSAQNSLFGGASSTPAGTPKPSPKPKAAAVSGAQPGSADYDPFATPTLAPLAHDESKFPANVTQSVLDAAIASGKNAGGGGGLGTKIVTIGGKKYICKSGTGVSKAAIENGFACDMAYRAGGVHAPDAKLYTFGGKVYKLAEFIEGTRLDKMVEKDEDSGAWNVPQSVRNELLKGYPLDALFSNWDVLGTNEGGGLRYTNIIVDKYGNAYRVDNDGAFAMKGLSNGGNKNPSQGNCNITGVDLEQWTSWKDRQFCDDWITMRTDPMNKGVFDRYSTHDIFSAAMAIDFDAACASLPKSIQTALAKPKLEMVQMTDRCRDNCNGLMSNMGSSMMLDGSYALSKDGAREACSFTTKNGTEGAANFGFGYTKDDGGSHSGYQKKPFPKIGEEPEKPEPPAVAHNYALDILLAVKTINYHNGGVSGMASGCEDHAPNKDKMAAYEKAKPIIEAQAKAGNEDAKVLIGFINDVEASKKAGYTKGIGMCPTDFIITDGSDQESIKKFNADMKVWTNKYNAWSVEKTAWDAQEAKNETEWLKTHHKSPYKSLVDQIDKQCTKSGCDHSWVSNAFKSQGGSSSNSSAVQADVVQAVLRGMDIQKENKFQQENPGTTATTMPGIDLTNISGSWKSHVQMYAKNPSKLMKDCRALAYHKAGIQLQLENLTMGPCTTAIDHDRHTIFVTRTESSDVYPEKYSHTEGTVCKKFGSTTSTSHSVGSVTFSGHHYGCRVPFSRITCSFFMEGDPGEGYYPFGSCGNYAGENEFAVDKTNLPHIPITYICNEANCPPHDGNNLAKKMKAYISLMKSHDEIVANAAEKGKKKANFK